MNKIWKCWMLPALISLPTQAAGWPPISPEVWALKEDPEKGIKDAIILEDRTVFHDTRLERILRIRVLTEAGRQAAHLEEFSQECFDFDGRTVYPDEKVVTYSKRQDFSRKESTVGNQSQAKTFLMPPGVTGNCVIELRWFEAVNYAWRAPLPPRMGYQATWRFGGPYFTLLETIEISQYFPWAYAVIPGRNLRLERIQRSGMNIIHAKNIPAIEHSPYSLSASVDRPLFMAYWQPRPLWLKADEGPKAYWDALGEEIWKKEFDSQIEKGKHYSAFKDLISAKVQSKAPQAMALELLSHLNQEILNTSRLTYAEAAQRTKDKFTPNKNNLNGICELRTASGMGMVKLCYCLLQDMGLSPKLALVADRDDRLFKEKVLNPWQLSDVLIAVEELGKEPLLIDPSMRFGPHGLILPDYQGVRGLLIDPKAKWSSQPFVVPTQEPSFNTRKYTYDLTLGESEDTFKVQAQFGGYPEFVERRKYCASEQVEQNRQLKEGLEKKLAGVSIGKTEVLNATSPKETVAWKAEGAFERESSRQRYIEPFPAMPWPLYVPDMFPKDRSLAIVLPYLQIHTGRSSIKAPKGFRLRLANPMEEQNLFGRVSWSMAPAKSGEDGAVEVTLEVSVDRMFAGPETYEEFKTYLGWISEACRRTVILEKI